jgi:CRP-like cAMP-binding protein
MVIKSNKDDVLIAENDGGKGFGFVRKGMVKVLVGDRTVALLGEGDIFGEIAYILDTRRIAKVVAASPDTEVVLFSLSAVKRLESEADKAIIWRNLARILAQKVLLTNKFPYLPE